MGFRLEFTPEAVEDLRHLRKAERKHIIAELEIHLAHEPSVETRNRKKLRPNQLAEWELRIGRFRVFYDVDMQRNRVRIEAVGAKRGNSLYIHGEEFQL